MKSKYLYSLIVIAILFSACSPMQSSVKKGSSKSYETFYLGDKGTQYFIKPLKFNAENGQKLLIDFTFRYNDQISNQDSVVVNFTILTNETSSNIKNIALICREKNIKGNQLQKMFSDEQQQRYTSKINIEDLQLFLKSKEPSITSDLKKYIPRNVTIKKMNKIVENIFRQ